MTPRLMIALFFIAISVHFSGAKAQNVYRCGSSYSQVPCPDGTEIQVQDPRTPEQKQASDARIRHDKEVAQGMEKARLKQEAERAKQEAVLAKQRAAQAKADAIAKRKEERDAKSAKKPSKKAKSQSKQKPKSSKTAPPARAAKPQTKASAAKL